MEMVIGIDASRNRSGGAKVHLIGILQESNPIEFGIREVHVWSYRSLLSSLPNYPWLVKHSPMELELSLFKQLWWQYYTLPSEARKCECDILLNTDAGSVCNFHPAVTMSRDMLSYEKGEIDRFNFGLARLRLFILRYVQSNSLKRADGVIFLTNYAAAVIQKYTGSINNLKVIPHGVGKTFKQITRGGNWSVAADKPIRCLYVSNVAMYKHQWHVVRAIHMLRQRNHNISILFAGGGDGYAQKLLDEEIVRIDPGREYIKQLGFVGHDKIPELLTATDIFIFASSCENMPNTLVEAMASGLPIACSNRGPMPEVLVDGGEYFDPENSESISLAIEKIIVNEDLRISMANRAKELSEQYSWNRCGTETWDFMKYIFNLCGK